MKSVYALFSYRCSPVAIATPKLVRVFANRKEAIAERARKNASANRNVYYVERVPFADEAIGEKA